MPPLLADWLQALAAWPVAAFFRASTIGYATLNAVHILSIGLIVGAIAALDLRMLGIFRSIPLRWLALPLVRVSATGVAAAITSGFLLFSVRPTAYVQNPAFLIKVTLVALGVTNALALRASGSWRTACQGGPIGWPVRLGAIVSLAIWFAAVMAGRWIGFLQ
jgi:hypothetical protein